ALVAVLVVVLERQAAVHRHREVAEHLPVAQEVLLDLPPLVAEAEHETVEPVVAVELHDVPKDRPWADLDHRLGAVLGLLAQARPLAAAEDDHRDLPAGQRDGARSHAGAILSRRYDSAVSAPSGRHDDQTGGPNNASDGDRRNRRGGFAGGAAAACARR